MGMVGAALAVFGIVQAGQQVSAGYAARGDAQVNAASKMYEAGIVDVQKRIADLQYIRQKDVLTSRIMARTGASGLAFSGTPMAVFTDVAAQIETDRLISQFNFDLQKQGKLSEAEAYRREGRQAVKMGYMNAFSTLLQTGASVGMRMPKGGRVATTRSGTQLRRVTMRQGFDEQALPSPYSSLYLGGAKYRGRI